MQMNDMFVSVSVQTNQFQFGILFYASFPFSLVLVIRLIVVKSFWFSHVMGFEFRSCVGQCVITFNLVL